MIRLHLGQWRFSPFGGPPSSQAKSLSLASSVKCVEQTLQQSTSIGQCSPLVVVREKVGGGPDYRLCSCPVTALFRMGTDKAELGNTGLGTQKSIVIDWRPPKLKYCSRFIKLTSTDLGKLW